MSQMKDEDGYKYKKRLQNVVKPPTLDELPDSIKEYHKKIERGEIVSEQTRKLMEKAKTNVSDEQNWLYYCPTCNKPSMEKTYGEDGKLVFHCNYCGLNTMTPRKVANFPQRNRMM